MLKQMTWYPEYETITGRKSDIEEKIAHIYHSCRPYIRGEFMPDDGNAASPDICSELYLKEQEYTFILALLRLQTMPTEADICTFFRFRNHRIYGNIARAAICYAYGMRVTKDPAYIRLAADWLADHYYPYSEETYGPDGYKFFAFYFHCLYELLFHGMAEDLYAESGQNILGRSIPEVLEICDKMMVILHVFEDDVYYRSDSIQILNEVCLVKSQVDEIHLLEAN